MKITEIQIERFGVWRDLTLSLGDPGVSVVYGPNEAGKSTLMRFVRGMLYGFRPTDERTAGPEGTFRSCAGAMRVDHRGIEYQLRRESHSGTRGRLSLNGTDSVGGAEERLLRLLSGAKEGVFENVFAIGLEELQQLSTLSGEEVARRIYGLSLGPAGRKILAAQSAAARETTRLLDLEQGQGEIANLSEQLEQLDRDLEMVHVSAARLTRLAEERLELYEEIDGRKQRQETLELNIRGHQFLDRVHGPWKRQRELRKELEALPAMAGLSEDALDRYDETELELDETLDTRTKLLAESRQFEDQAEMSDLDTPFEENICGIRSLLERHDDVRKMERELEAHQHARAERKKGLQKQLDGLECEVTWDRLERFDASGAALASILSSGDEYRKSVWRRARTIKQYRALQKGAQKRQSLLQEGLKRLSNRSIVEARQETRRRLAEVEELSDLRAKEQRLAETEDVLIEQLKAFPRRRDLPQYFPLVMWVFGVAGLLVFLFGLTSLKDATVQGGNVAWISGLIYLLLGACLGGVTWMTNEHFRQFLDWDPSQLRERLEEIGRDRERTIKEIRRVLGADVNQQAAGLRAVRGEPLPEVDEQQIISQLHHRLAELDELERLERRVASDRERLSRRREQLQQHQRAVGAARRVWTDLLRQLGLGESLRVPETLEVWQGIAEVQREWKEWRQEENATQHEEKTVREFHEEVARLARALAEPGSKSNDSYALIAQWDMRLRQIEAARRERKKLLQEARHKRREAERLDGTIDSLRTRRMGILSRAGAADREDLATRVASIQRRSELTRLIEQSRKEVDAASTSEPDLAIVEDDLIRFDAARNQQAIHKHRSELKELDGELQSLHERLGQLKREIQQIEEDGSLESLSRKRKRLALELRDATERWTAAQLAGQAVERVRRRVERNCQPETLKLASEYLERLTCGKYTNVWAPLGEKHLVIDDERSESFRVEHLSSGTREQLFLAVRMAMIRELADQGVELPMVLDDVLVNFDQTRTEAAVDTLLDFADEGQQVLFFTCHLHLANLFETRGAEPIYLPGHEPAMERVG